MSKKRLIKVLVFPTIGIFLSLIIIELLLSITKIIPMVPHFTHQSEILGFEHIPNTKGTYSSQEFLVNVNINNQGFRHDSDVSTSRREGIKRIALVGDSFVEGVQVDLNKTAGIRLEENLNFDSKTEKYEVLNFGVSGYGMDQKFLYLKKNVLAFQPDLVVLFFASNDLDDVRKNNIVKINDKNELEFDKFPQENKYVTRIKDLLRHFYIANVLFRVKTNIHFKTNQISSETRIPTEYQLYQGKMDNQSAYYFEIIKKLIIQSKKITGDSGTKLLLVGGVDKTQTVNSYPNKFTDQYNVSNFEPDFINNLLGGFAQENNIEYLDLLPVFKKVNNPADLFFAKDGHWSQYGHEVVAEALKTKIDEMEGKSLQ